MSIGIDLKRFESVIRDLENDGAREGSTLLYGSSFFTHWKGASSQLREASAGHLDVWNRGFGGAISDELLYYYPRLVRPIAPKAIILRAGVNDICAALQSPEESWIMSERVIEWARTDFPGVRIGILGVFHSKNEGCRERQKETDAYNEYARAYAENRENTVYLDADPFFTAPDGSLRDLFVADGLHLTDAAYEAFARFFAPLLIESGF